MLINQKYLLTAPSIILNISHRYPQITNLDVGVNPGTVEVSYNGHKNIAKNPVSSNCDSQPTIERQLHLLRILSFFNTFKPK